MSAGTGTDTLFLFHPSLPSMSHLSLWLLLLLHFFQPCLHTCTRKGVSAINLSAKPDKYSWYTGVIHQTFYTQNANSAGVGATLTQLDSTIENTPTKQKSCVMLSDLHLLIKIDVWVLWVSLLIGKKLLCVKGERICAKKIIFFLNRQHEQSKLLSQIKGERRPNEITANRKGLGAPLNPYCAWRPVRASHSPAPTDAPFTRPFDSVMKTGWKEIEAAPELAWVSLWEVAEGSEDMRKRITWGMMNGQSG